MTIDEAIKTNTALAKELDIPERIKEKKAVQLGIEALKRFEENRRYAPPQIPRPLPGETVETSDD